jgi:c-di-GMP-binding flagellar brake protein YcgR
MTTPERRKYPRVEVYYPISYACMNENGRIVQENMGVALDISQGGILIETAVGVFSKYIKLISTDHNKNIIEIKGKVAYCKRTQSEKYRTGISFAGTHAQNINFAKKLIKSYHYKKSEYRYNAGSQHKTTVV